MSTKHNTKHDRGRSHYSERLAKRGLSKTPAMTPVEQLRKVQDNRVKATCTIGHDHFVWNCDGHPWWTGKSEGDTPDIFAA